MKRIILLVVFLLVSANSAFSQLVVNEVMPANGKSYLDDDGENSDWIELKNVSLAPINLSNYYISDKNKASAFVRLPERVLAPGEIIVVFASDKPSSRTVPNELTCDGGGFFGYWSNFDTGYFFYDSTADSVLTAVIRVNHLKSNDGNARIGLIAREKLDSISRYTGLFVGEDMKWALHVNPGDRPDSGSKFFGQDRIDLECEYPYVYLKIEYKSDSIYCYASIDKVWWQPHVPVYFPLTKNFYPGIAFSPSSDKNATVFISEISINGNEYPDGLPNLKNYAKGHVCSQSKSKAIHLPIKLSTDKEAVFIANKEKKVIDSISWTNAIGDVSIGRSITDGGIVRFDRPTPGTENGSGYRAQAPMPKLNLPTNYYQLPISVALEGTNPELSARYTIDCTEPTLSSPVLPAAPINTDTNLCLRVKYFSEADTIMPSPTKTNAYIYDAPTVLPVFSVVTDPKYLWSDSLGILFEGDSALNKPTNIWQDWERPASVTLLRGGRIEFSLDMGVGLRGYYGSRIQPQKSFNLSARTEYGISDIDCKIFPNKKADSYKRIMLRNGGQDWAKAMIRDAVCSELAQPIDIDYKAYFPCRLFLNGAYWGLYFCMEKNDEHFISTNYDCDKEDITVLLAEGNPEAGSSLAFRTKFNAMVSSDLENDSVFAEMTKFIDLNNLIDYYNHEIIISNIDWPGNNLKMWQNHKEDSKWRFILYDCDWTLALESNEYYNSFDHMLSETATNWCNSPASTLMIRSLFRNQNFKRAFISRFADMLNSSHSTKRIIRVTDSIYSLIREELPAHNARWGNPLSGIESELDRIRSFATNRPSVARGYAAYYIENSPTFSLEIESNRPDSLSMDVNTLKNLPGEFAGVYFNSVPVRVVLRPAAGLRVKQIEGYAGEVKDTIILTTAKDTLRIKVILESTTTPAERPNIVINEIMYKACDEFDSKDWIEIYNDSEFEADLAGWTLRDDKDEDSFIFPTGSVLAPREYLVICEDTTQFSTIYPEVRNIVGCFDFGFGRGDEVRLFDGSGILADSLRYEKSSPWPALADGACYSIELISPKLDNRVAESWNSSADPKGTPGRANSRLQPAKDKFAARLAAAIAPNPVDSRASIRIESINSEFATLSVINSLGNVVSTFTGRTNEIYELDLSQLPSGAYIIRLVSGTETSVLRFVKQ